MSTTDTETTETSEVVTETRESRAAALLPDITAKSTERQPAEVEAKPEVKQETKPEEKGPSLAELIRQDRTERAARAQADADAKSWKAKAEAAEAKLAEFTGERDDIVLDPVDYLSRRKLSNKELALVGETILYSLVPEKAPPDHRARLVEAQLKRNEKLQAERAAAAEAEARAAAEAREREAKLKEISGYQDNLSAVAQTWDKEAEHPFPVSSGWFEDDPAAYTQSLMQTAINLAESAQERGEKADLSPRAVAAVLEEHLRMKHARATARSSKKTPAAAPTTQKPEARKPAEKLSADPAPLKTKKMTPEEERIYRASQVVFGTNN